jgi:hypothetical protein
VSSLFIQNCTRQNIAGTFPFEPKVGYCRAVRAGNTIHLAGTTGVNAEGKVEGDAYAQSLERERGSVNRELGLVFRFRVEDNIS